MSIKNLIPYLPEGTLPYLKTWIADHSIHLVITRDRNSKLGDYCLKRDGSHRISVNSTLAPELFFFVLTHELAHLIAFAKFGRKIAPHGPEWKHTYREMLKESIEIYSDNLKPIISNYARSPKANYMANPELVAYFERKSLNEGEFYIQELQTGNFFSFRGTDYRMEGKIKKNYLCTNLSSGRKYAFRPLAKVTKKK